MKPHFALLACLVSSAAFAGFKGDQFKVVYGADDRLDIRDVTDPALVEAARSTAAMIASTKIVTDENGKITLSTENLRTHINACEGEPFTEQPSSANCSGFLVAPDLVVTAGHCMVSADKCSTYKWVFDYRLDTPGVESVELKSENIYNCTEIVKQVLTEDTLNDYAVVRLDRPVTDRQPLKFRTEGRPALAEKLVVIGHPSGIPTKVAGGAEIKAFQDNFFTANLDTYGGNSGSAVLNAETLEVEGILVRGNADYNFDFEHMCRSTNYLPDDNATFESVTYITNVLEIMPATPPVVVTTQK